MAVRRVRKEDMVRMAKMTWEKVVATMDDLEGYEVFEQEWLGSCGTVSEEKVGGVELIYFRHDEDGVDVGDEEDLENGKEETNQESTENSQTDPTTSLSSSSDSTPSKRATTVILRGANEYMLDEMDRSFHDTLCVLKRILESNTLVAGILFFPFVVFIDHLFFSQLSILSCN